MDTGPVACNEELKIDLVLTPPAEEKEGVPRCKAIFAIVGFLIGAYCCIEINEIKKPGLSVYFFLQCSKKVGPLQ